MSAMPDKQDPASEEKPSFVNRLARVIKDARVNPGRLEERDVATITESIEQALSAALGPEDASRVRTKICQNRSFGWGGQNR